MTQKLPQRDRLGMVEGNHERELPAILLNRRVEIEPALLDKLHDGQRVEQLRDRAGAETLSGSTEPNAATCTTR